MCKLFKCHSGEVFSRDLVESYNIPQRFGCWGEIKLSNKKEETVGDGSYYLDGKHVDHLCFNFKRFHEWMEGNLEKKHIKGIIYDGSVLFKD